MNVRAAIDAGDVGALQGLLRDEPALANRLVEWGDHGQLHTHPLHYVCDKLFDGALSRGRELPLIEALLKAGADCNDHGEDRETPLLGAASLGAVDVGLRLLDAGAAPGTLGMFRETALHWAATLGLETLCARLIEQGADVNLIDARFDASPVGWALHGRATKPPGSQGGHFEVIRRLVAAGAKVEFKWLVSALLRADFQLLAALRGR